MGVSGVSAFASSSFSFAATMEEVPFASHHDSEAFSAMWTASPIKPLFLSSLGYVFISSMKMDEYSKLVPAAWGIAEKISKNVEVTLELGNRQRLE